MDLPELTDTVGFLDPLSTLNIMSGQMKVLGSTKNIIAKFTTDDLLMETTYAHMLMTITPKLNTA